MVMLFINLRSLRKKWVFKIKSRILFWTCQEAVGYISVKLRGVHIKTINLGEYKI